MGEFEDSRVRLASADDAVAAGLLLFDFNTEYDDPTPPADEMADRVVQLLEHGDTRVLLAGDGPDGIAVLRIRPAVWAFANECYLAELYVRPAQRGIGLGRGLLRAAKQVALEADCAWMDLGTNEVDEAARALYESEGFTNLEDGTPNYFYEIELRSPAEGGA